MEAVVDMFKWFGLRLGQLIMILLISATAAVILAIAGGLGYLAWRAALIGWNYVASLPAFAN